VPFLRPAELATDAAPTLPVYVTRRDVLVGGSLYGAHIVGHEVAEADHVNIDTPDDWARAEALLARRA
jgi:CTP:molybdopterin cytidylyltransferase MocA